MKDLIKAKYYVYKNPMGEILPFDIVYQNSNDRGDKWLECVECDEDGEWASVGDIGIAWMRSIQHRKLKPEQIPESVRIFAEWISTPAEVQP